MTTSLAAVFDGTAGKLELRSIPTPEPRKGEILARVLGCTLCGSDLHTFDGRRSVPVPTVLGHEYVGVIAALGPSAPPVDLAGAPLRVGDRVTWAIVASCGDCFYCTRSLPQKCQNGVKYGHEAFAPGRELLGGLAEHCLLVPGTSIVRLPDELPLEVGCPTSCSTATVAAALEAAGAITGQRICILGAGLLGLTACAFCRALGAAQIIAVDVNEGRRQRALEFGATHVSPPDELATKVLELTAGQGLDVAFEFSGASSAFTTAFPLVRIGGTIVLIGSVFPGPGVPIPLEQIVRRNLTIRGVHNYAPKHLLAAVQFLKEHHTHYPFLGLVAGWYSLPAALDAFASARDPNAVRIGVRPE